MLVLSPLTVMSKSANSCGTSHMMASSRATDLAHPIYLSPACQPSQRCHAAQRLATTIPIPQDDEASTQMSGLILSQMVREWEPQGTDRTNFHQQMESTMEAGTCLHEKLLGNLAMNAERGGRVEQPSLYINVTCCNKPWRERQSHWDTVDEDDDKKELTLISSFNRFLSRSETVQRSRSHNKLRYLIIDTKY